MRTYTVPPTHYAHTGDASIAYQVFGTGPIDLVLASGPASHVEIVWEEPAAARSLRRLAGYARVVLFDRRGTGLSDPVEAAPTLEQQMDDLLAVMADVGMQRAALYGATDAGLCAMTAATHPDKVTSLVLWGVAPYGGRIISPDLQEQLLELARGSWGRGDLLPIFAPSRVTDANFSAWWARYERYCAAPGMARKLLALFAAADLRQLLPLIRCPTLVLHRRDDAFVPSDAGREVAAAIPNARFVEVPGTDNWGLDDDPALEGIVEEFLTGQRHAADLDRVLATVLFTDLVDSTVRAAAAGDQRWRLLLEQHDECIEQTVTQWRGRVVKTTGDGVLATFDGPARAVRCARMVVDGLAAIGLPARAGLHTGECEVLGEDIGGLAVHLGARVCAAAGSGEVLVTSTVKDLVVGSGLSFTDRGARALKGIPEEWRLFCLD